MALPAKSERSPRLTPETLAQIRAVRAHAGVWRHDGAGFVRIEGPDAATWLQTQTPNDVLSLGQGAGQASALLDRKAYLQAHFTLHRWDDSFWVLIERPQVAGFLEHLNNHLFLEQAELADASDELDQVLVQGPRSAGLLSRGMVRAEEQLPPERFDCRPIEAFGFQILAFRIGTVGEDGFVLAVEAGQGVALCGRLIEAGQGDGVLEIGPEAHEVLRIEAGVPRYGRDMDASNRLPETTLEREAVSYDKGCYLGQEVVAKLRAYSSVPYALMGLVFDAPNDVPPADSPIVVEHKPVGTIKSRCWSPTLEAPIALAYLGRNHRDPGATLTFSMEDDGRPVTARTVVLPFYEAPSREAWARQLYEEALAHFEADADDKDDRGIRLLHEAILLAPKFEDAYEALGVILNRHGRVDEAIHYMQCLERLNPDCIMAHTNLSVFYMTKGLIQEAEEEKAKAAVLQIKAASSARQAEAIAKAERERIEQEARERMEMFREVLEIDPDDALATYGMGMAHVQLNEPAEAIPYFERATTLQKDYSAAFLNLGKCYEAIGDTANAAETFRRGIAAANRKGDLMPMREMERRLKQLAEID